MTDDHIHYSNLIDQGMRHVVREVLRRVQNTGLPGEHHFYISYNTMYPGVKMSDQLRAKYPREITIVMQHQFWDFKVEDHQFHVTLSFGGMPEKLTVPFAALTAFADPSVKFGLQFQHSDTAETTMVEVEDINLGTLTGDSDDAASAEIISLEAFRKK